jgi:hypothetical protein
VSRSQGISFAVLIIAAGTIAAIVGGAGRVSADPLSVNRPPQSGVDPHRHTPAYQLHPKPDITTVHTLGTGLPGHANLTATGTLPRYLLSSIQLTGREGDWVALVGLGRPDNSAFGRESMVPARPSQESRIESWFYTVEMIFVPKDSWSIGAGFSLDAGQLHDALSEPFQRMEPPHFNLFLMLDFGSSRKLGLDLGYGRLPVEAYAAAKSPGLLPFDSDQQDAIHAESQVYSVCLNIQF